FVAKDGWANLRSIPSTMENPTVTFPFNLYLVGFMAAFGCGLILVPVFRSWSYKVGLVDDPGHRKIHTTPIALAGGIAVLAAIILPLVVGGFVLLFPPFGFFTGGVSNLLLHGFSEKGSQIVTIVAGAAAMALLGWVDDKHELKAGPKFFGQFIVALLVAAAGIRITLFVPNPMFSYAITIIWILAVTNAFNFMDNMNGLCGGVGMISCWACAWTAALQGQYLVSLLAFVVCGALLAFLPYNYPTATVFLGDAGSHLIGFLTAVLSILPHFYSREWNSTWAVLSPLFILAVPLLDLAWVVALRTRMGKPFYIGDTNHFSHQLVRRGISKSSAVAVLWLASALFSFCAFLLFVK
ncbi:MAG: glycosyltransferase family 4 protein, partial [Verrucomicrobiales bacterium]